MFKKITALLLAIAVLTGCVGISEVASAKEFKTQSSPVVDSKNKVELKSNKEKRVAPIVARIIVSAAGYAVKKLGKKVADDVWPVVKKKLDDLLEKAEDISIKGPGGGERVFAIFDKNKEIFRLDAKLLKKPDGYYLWVHYHITPDMSEHHDIAEIYMGKNKPAGW
ncbi:MULTISPECIES: YpjP family protein [Brevibacillus]|uniref:YpjP family protein n=1 Tax=Brevibacillus TaxID=55080 RepID=UPI0004705D00|nr:MULTISPECIES: YpjP family protein [Brevibacillus]QHZ59010.1 hypothetical protein M655_027285 [Brevibacillus sp. NSP2.1]